MDYELCKQLKDAGFPQKLNPDDIDRAIKHFGNEQVYFPTLEELIEAIGDDFKCVRNFRHEMWAAHGKEKGDRQWRDTWGGDEWVAEAVSTYEGSEGTIGPICANGESPLIAAARLYVALNKKQD